MSEDLSHFDASGQPRMVDVSHKEETDRIAVAGCSVLMQPQTLERIRSGGTAKGDVLAIAHLAGIMAAKRAADLIPLCHPLPLTAVDLSLAPAPDRNAIDIVATVKLHGRTGAEMEALTAAAVAGLTIYDMCKAVDRAMSISDLRLHFKSGGKSGTYEAPL